MTPYPIETRTGKYFKGYGFLSFAKIIENNHWIQQ